MNKLPAFLAAAAVTFFLVGAGHDPSQRPPYGLNLFVPFNTGDAKDYSPFNRTPTLNNGAVITAGNRYMTLDGVNDYLSFPDADDLSFGSGGTDSPFTISMWIRTTTPTTRQFLISKRTISTYEWQLEYRGTTGAGLELVLATSGASEIISRYDAGRTLTSGRWYHVAATYSGNKAASGIKLYLDGVQVDDTSGALASYSGMSNTTNPVAVGCLPTNILPFAGDIDDVRIYRRALPAEEIAQLNSAGRP